MRSKALFLSLALALVGALASADVILPGSRYFATVETEGDLARLLLDSVRFQSVANVTLRGTGNSPTDPASCPAQIKVWTLGGNQIRCQTRASCFYKAGPKCTLSFGTWVGATPEQLLKFINR